MAPSESRSSFKRGIVVFHKWLDGAGGAERLAVEEYRYLKRCGIRTWFLTFEVAPRGLFGLDARDVEFIQRKSEFGGMLQLRRRLKELDPDLIILACGLRDLYFANFFLNIPYILHQHEAPYKIIAQERQTLLPLFRRTAAATIKDTAYGYRFIPVPPPATSLPETLRREFLSLVDYFAVKQAAEVTLLSTRAVREVNLLHGRAATALRGCLPQEIFSYQPKEDIRRKLGLNDCRILLSVSRLDARKRIDVIIEAFAQLASTFEDTFLVIGGTGPHEATLKALVAQLGLTSRVIFLGFIPDDDLWDILSSCDIFVCADWTDFDIAPYEALAFGRRVVWSSEMETDALLERLGAVFVAEPSSDRFAEVMHCALSSPEADRPALVGFLQQFTWDNYFRQVVELARSVAERHAVPEPALRDAAAKLR